MLAGVVGVVVGLQVAGTAVGIVAGTVADIVVGIAAAAVGRSVRRNRALARRQEQRGVDGEVRVFGGCDCGRCRAAVAHRASQAQSRICEAW